MVVSLYKEGQTRTQIVAHVGISRNHVSKILSAAGYHGRRKWTTEDIMRVKELRAKNTPWDAIAKEFGTKIPNVSIPYYTKWRDR